jgi:ferredoxin--NADP+ reductase
VSGWIKRGPSGVIGTNKKDSQDTVNKILEDVTAGRVNAPISEDIEALIATHCPDAVSWEGWQAIDAIETAAGGESAPARPRVKLTDWEALRAAGRRAATGDVRH